MLMLPVCLVVEAVGGCSGLNEVALHSMMRPFDKMKSQAQIRRLLQHERVANIDPKSA